MDQAAMVDADIRNGSEIVGILERAGIKPLVAAWMLLTEYGDWRFVIAARKLDVPDPGEAYRLVREAVEAAGVAYWKVSPMLVLRTTDPTVRELRRAFRKAKSEEGMRLGGQLFGDRFVEDGYVYRIS